jgi:hypothetical protein
MGTGAEVATAFLLRALPVVDGWLLHFSGPCVGAVDRPRFQANDLNELFFRLRHRADSRFAPIVLSRQPSGAQHNWHSNC